jgi:O-antigen ligase
MSTYNTHNASFRGFARRPSVPAVVATLSAVAALICATGVTESAAFQQASTLKYVVTVAGPLLIMCAALSRHPLRVIMLPAIVAAPFESVTFNFAGQRPSAILPLLIAGALVAPFTGSGDRRLSRLAPAGFLAFPLLLLPLADGKDVRPFVSTLAVFLAFAWLVALTAREEGGMRAVLWTVAIGAVVQGGIAIWESRTGHLLNFYGLAGTQQYASSYLFTYGTTQRVTGTFTDPISLGNVLAISLPLCVVLAATEAKRAAKWCAVGACVVVATALALTLSRDPWIAGTAGSVLAVVLLPRGARGVGAKTLAGCALLVCVVALATEGTAVLGRLGSIGDPTAVQGQTLAQQGVAVGDRDRLKFWGIALHGFEQHPAEGVGIGRFAQYLQDRVQNSGNGIRAGTAMFLHAHSTYFEILVEAGLFGLALLVLFVSGLVRDAVASVRDDPLIGAGLAGAALALLICWVTDWVIQNSPVAACVGVVVGAIAAGGARARANAERMR